MKSMYINPQTDLMSIEAVNYIAAGSPAATTPVDNNPTPGMDGAPSRGGEFLPL